MSTVSASSHLCLPCDAAADRPRAQIESACRHLRHLLQAGASAWSGRLRQSFQPCLCSVARRHRLLPRVMLVNQVWLCTQWLRHLHTRGALCKHIAIASVTSVCDGGYEISAAVATTDAVNVLNVTSFLWGPRKAPLATSYASPSAHQGAWVQAMHTECAPYDANARLSSSPRANHS